MRTRYLVLSGFCAVAVVLLALRWPRLDPDAVSVTRSETGADEMVVEYRMPRPFEVGLQHGIRKPHVWPAGPSIHAGDSTEARREPGEVIPSEYDWLRGEHYVRLTFRRASALVIDANGRHLEFPAWSGAGAATVQWHPPGERVRLGDGIGKDIVSFAASAEQHEYLILYAGTDVRHSVD